MDLVRPARSFEVMAQLGFSMRVVPHGMSLICVRLSVTCASSARVAKNAACRSVPHAGCKGFYGSIHESVPR